MRMAVKTQNGFKTIMSVLAAEETRNKANIEALNPSLTPPTNPTVAVSSAVQTPAPAQLPPATNITLNSIMGRK